MLYESGQSLNCFVDWQLRFVCVDLRREFDVAMPQKLHRKALGDSMFLQKCRPGIAQRVEVGVSACFVLIGDAVGFQSARNRLGCGTSLGKTKS